MAHDLQQIFSRYMEVLHHGWPLMILSSLVVLLILLLWQRLPNGYKKFAGSPWTSRLLLIAFVATGLYLAWTRASLVDDAFISFRYSRNWANGLGLVFNAGEHVEGYTNFLWTILIGLAVKLTSLEAPAIALVLGPACFIANIAVVYKIGRSLATRFFPRPYIPVSAMLLSVQVIFVSFATTGLETMMASLFVNLGVFFILKGEGPRYAFATGFMLILSVFTRPDHSLFYLAGGIALLARNNFFQDRKNNDGASANWSYGMKVLGAYAAPFVTYLAYLGWKLYFYGSILPNTFYAKSVEGFHTGQGLLYTLTFLLGSHFWIVGVLFLAWILTRQSSQRVTSVKIFFGISVALYLLYILKVGGDFMYGRFFLTLMPMLLLGAENLLYRQYHRAKTEGSHGSLRVSVFITVLLATTVHGHQFIHDKEVFYNIAYESSFYRLKTSGGINSDLYDYGNELKRLFTDRGLKPSIAVMNTGMLSYYSEFPVVVDLLGLTDSFIARQPPTIRGRPGHEKVAPASYIMDRGIHLVWRLFHPEKYRPLTRIHLGLGEVWRIATYDRELMNEIKRKVPEVQFIDFELFLDQYIAGIQTRNLEKVRQDFTWFKAYYFDHNEDPKRLAVFLETTKKP